MNLDSHQEPESDVQEPESDGADRPLLPPTVWLASFPKSGNTWMRAIITAVRGGEEFFSVGRLSSGAQPHYVGAASVRYGLDPRWLSRTELRMLRDSLVSQVSPPRPEGMMPVFRKTHEVYRSGPAGQEPFPTEATRAAILIVRDPRAVACSWAPFFGVDHAGAVERMGSVEVDGRPTPANCETEQPWGGWSAHALSWLDDSVPFPVHVVRYEALLADPIPILLPLFAAVGWEVAEADLVTAVQRTAFERLAADEEESGFRETSPKAERFFRRGGRDWREELSDDLAEKIVADHSEVMVRLGYLPESVDLTDRANDRSSDWDNNRDNVRANFRATTNVRAGA